jgi:hypothetical protein
MEFCFEPDKAALKIKWTSDNSSLSTVDYIDCWNAILRHVEVLKPVYLLIDASEFEYRILPEVNHIFNDISQKLIPKNIAIITSNNLLGSKTLESLLKSCPIKGYNIFKHRNEGHVWLESHNPIATL